MAIQACPLHAPHFPPTIRLAATLKPKVEVIRIQELTCFS